MAAQWREGEQDVYSNGVGGPVHLEDMCTRPNVVQRVNPRETVPASARQSFPVRERATMIPVVTRISEDPVTVPAATGDEGRKTLQEELDEVRSDIIRLAALTTEAIAAGTQAFLDGDLGMAESVVEGDDRIDELYHQVDDRLLLILATQSPVAVDLRAVVTMMRINHELERDADLMVNVAKTTRRIYPHELDPKVRGIIDRMGVQSSNQTRLAIDAFADSDPSWAAALSDMDDTMDELTKSLFRHILAWGASDEATVLQAVQVALVGRHYERIADHAVTIAERVEFMVTGTHPGTA
jgi:phosphate transport system protein